MSPLKGGLVVVSSRNNLNVKQIRNLRHRRERDRTGLFFIEGIRIVAEAVQLGAAIERLVVAPARLTSAFGRELVRNQQRSGVPCLEVTDEVFASLSLKEGPQGLGAVVRQKWESLDQIALLNEGSWVALDGVQDPGNLGTILRTTDAVGFAGVILIGQTTDPYDPTALRASMGAIFSQRLVRSSPIEFAAWKRKHNHAVVGTSGAAAVDYRAFAYPCPLILLMGSERLGLSRWQQGEIDATVAIPMKGRSDSLNLAVATGVVLYEIFYQHRGGRAQPT